VEPLPGLGCQADWQHSLWKVGLIGRPRHDCSKASVLASARATLQAASLTSRTILRAGMFGQQFGLSGHARHTGTGAMFQRTRSHTGHRAACTKDKLGITDSLWPRSKGRGLSLSCHLQNKNEPAPCAKAGPSRLAGAFRY
jgi:hypothetical protein